MDEVKQFINGNKEFFSQPIINSFIKNDYHRDLLRKVIEENDSEADGELNRLFMDFYLKYKLLKYIDVLAHNYSIEFDKARKKRTEKYLLQLDQSISDEEDGGTFIDFIQDNELSPFNKVIEESYNIAELIEKESISHAFEQLSAKQKEILELTVIRQWSNKEIAEYFGNSPQNISKLKKNAISCLRKELDK